MAIEKNCLRCGGKAFERGTLEATGRLSFKPDNAKFFTLRLSTVPVKADLCLECGAIELVGDVEKVQALVGKGGPGDVKE